MQLVHLLATKQTTIMILFSSMQKLLLAIGLVLVLFVSGIVFIAAENEPTPEARTLSYLPYTLSKTANKQDLLRGLEVLEVPYPELLLKVAVAETGHCFDDGVGEINNLFAMRCHDRVWQCGCTDHGYAVYPNITASLYDIREWAEIEPPTPNEKGTHWLKRRGFNPFPTYWVYLETVDPEFGAPCPNDTKLETAEAEG